MADQKEPTKEEQEALAKIRNTGPSSYAKMQAEAYAKRKQESKMVVPQEPQSSNDLESKPEPTIFSISESGPEEEGKASTELFPDKE